MNAQIKWYSSKVVWAGIVTSILGIIPLVAVFLKVLEPQWAVVIDAALVMVSGILTVVWRIWFTNATIATPPFNS